MPLGGSHGIAIDPTRLDARAPAALYGVVDADHHLAVRQQPFDDIEQQPPRDRPRIPTSPAQHLVIATEPCLVGQSHHA
jgi:hypothetical protein